MAKKRLFSVMNTRSREIVKNGGIPQYFTNKQTAKKERDTLIEEAGEDIYTVALGPDHRRYDDNPYFGLY